MLMIPETIFAILFQVVEGLSHLHAVGFAHLNIKPSQIIMFPNMRVKLGDYGTSRYLGQKRHINSFWT